MPRIKHCGSFRRTDNHWLHSCEEIFRYQILMSANCPNCGQFVMEWVGVKHDMSFASRHRIPTKKHQEWIVRTDIAKGDIAEGLDSSQWGGLRNGVHWVTGSSNQFPYLKRRVRVE